MLGMGDAEPSPPLDGVEELKEMKLEENEWIVLCWKKKVTLTHCNV